MNPFKIIPQFFVMLAAGLWLTACNKGNDFAPLKNGEGLRAACGILMNSYPQGEIPQGAWSRVIKELKPTRVVHEKLGVRIFLQDAHRSFKGGYLVFLDPNFAPSTQGVWIQKTKFKGIYQFKNY